jgi:hypothetical protein
MAYIDKFEEEFKTNLLQLRLNVTMVTDDKIKKSLVKDNIESHIISALTLGARQFIDSYFFCVLKVIKDNIKIEDLKTESIFNKYKNKFRRRFLDLYEDLDVIFSNGTDLDVDYILVLNNNTLVNTLIERNNQINQFNSNYSNLEALPSSKSSDITEFKVSLELKKDDYENSVFSKAMGDNIKINGIIKPNVKGEETKLFCTITGFSDSKKLEIESEPSREIYYKGTGGHNGFLMFETGLFKPIIEEKIFNYLKDTLKINISKTDIKIKIENDQFKDKSITDNKDLEYKLIITNPKDDEKDIKGVIRIKKTINTLGLKYDLNSISYIYGYKDEKIEHKKEVKDLLVRFEKLPTEQQITNDKYKMVDDIEEYEKLISDTISILEKNFQTKFNKVIKLKVVREEVELKNTNQTPTSEIKEQAKDELIAEYSVKISGEGSIESKEQPIGIFKVGTKGRIVEAINKKVSVDGSEYLKKTHENILSLQKSFQKTKKIRIDGVVGDETWVPVFGYDRTLVDGSIKIYSDGITPYSVSTLTISDKKIELTSGDSKTIKKAEDPKEDPSLIELNLIPGSNYSKETLEPVAKIIILKNDIFKSGYGKIENLKGNALIQFNTPFENSSIDKLKDDVIKGLQQKLDSSYPNFAVITSKEIINNDVNVDNLNNKDNPPITDVDKLSTNALVELEQECLKQGIKTFLKKIEKPIEIILKGDGNFTIFVESPKNDTTSKINGEINFMITNTSITGMCEILGLPENYTNPKTKTLVTTSEYIYNTSQSTDSPQNRIQLGNEALSYFQNKIKVDYDLDIKLALKDKFAEKLENYPSNNPMISTKYSEMDGEWIFNVEKENTFYSKDFGDLIIIGDANVIEHKIDNGLLDDEYSEDPYAGEAETSYIDEYMKNQEELINELTFEIAYTNIPYLEKQKEISKSTTPESTAPTSNDSGEISTPGTATITPVGGFKLYDGKGLDRIGKVIQHYESAFDHTIFNYTKSGGKIPNKELRKTVSIHNMTVSELYKYMTNETHPNLSGRIFATGLYQVIPTTLAGNMKAYNLDWNSKYDFNFQTELGHKLILARGGNYLKAKNSGSQSDLEKAIQSIGTCWAALPIIWLKSGEKVGDVTNGGGKRAYYGGVGPNGATSHFEIGTIALNLIKARVELTGSKPSFIPDYVKNQL